MAPGRSRMFNCLWRHCGKSFHRKSDLGRHYRIHTNERPYQCTMEGCNKRFVQRSALTVHSRTHTGEKPHTCGQDGCHKAFADSSSLARHRRIHTGMRPYVCQEHTCKRSFCRKTTLTKHQYQFHSLGSVAAPSLGDTILGQFYEKCDSTSASYNQNLLLQQPYYGQSTTSNFGFDPQQNQNWTYAAAQEVLLSTTIQNVPAMVPFDIQHTQQQYMQMMHQQYDQSHPNYMPPGLHEPFSSSHPMAEESYHDSVLAGLAPQVHASSQGNPSGWRNL